MIASNQSSSIFVTNPANVAHYSMGSNCVPNASNVDFHRSWASGQETCAGVKDVFRSWIGPARFVVLENFKRGENPAQLPRCEVVNQTNRFGRQEGVGFDLGCTGFLQRHAARIVRGKDFGQEYPTRNEPCDESIGQSPELRRAKEVQHGLGDDQVVD